MHHLFSTNTPVSLCSPCTRAIGNRGYKQEYTALTDCTAPPAPAIGQDRLMSRIYRRGRVLRGIERAFVANDMRPVSTSEIMAHSFALALYQGKTSKRERENHARSIRRACDRLCVRLGHAAKPGRPVLWQLREP